jgi:PhnB protein
MAVKPTPAGYHSVTPYLICGGAADAIEYYKAVFGATEIMRMPGPGNKVGHAEIMIGDSHVMLADEHVERGMRGPRSIGGSAVMLTVYVPDVDGSFRRGIERGGKELQPVETKFYGDRMGTLEDPFGHVWAIGTHVEDVPPEEMHKRAQAQAQKG